MVHQSMNFALDAASFFHASLTKSEVGWHSSNQYTKLFVDTTKESGSAHSGMVESHWPFFWKACVEASHSGLKKS